MNIYVPYNPAEYPDLDHFTKGYIDSIRQGIASFAFHPDMMNRIISLCRRFQSDNVHHIVLIRILYHDTMYELGRNFARHHNHGWSNWDGMRDGPYCALNQYARTIPPLKTKIVVSRDRWITLDEEPCNVQSHHQHR